MSEIAIGGRPVGDDAPTYFIAEIGSNHDGSLEEAVRLTEASAKAGADCVKFQSYRAETLASREHPGYATLERLALQPAWYPRLKAAADVNGVHFTSTPFDLEALAALVALGVPAVKVASGDLTYADLLRAAAGTGLPVVLSTGAAYLGEVDEALRTFRDAGGKEIALLHCASLYPAKFEAVNLRALVTIRVAFDVPVGFSDHTPGWAADVAAVALGARIIEKHVTFDRARKGPDHPYAMLVAEFAEMVRAVRAAEAALGTGAKEPAYEEFPEREWARRGVYAARDLAAGHTLAAEDLVCLRPVRGVPASRKAEMVGLALRHAVAAGRSVGWDAL